MGSSNWSKRCLKMIHSSLDGIRPSTALATPSERQQPQMTGHHAVLQDICASDVPYFSGDVLPSYTRTEQHPVEALTQFYREQTAEAETHITSEASRLHNFLIYCLKADYGITPLVRLAPVDLKHFLRLAQYLSDLNYIDNDECNLHIVEHDVSGIPGVLDAYVFEPVKALRLPIIPVLRMLATFRLSIGTDLGYNVADSYLQGMDSLARKLALDRETMIDAIVPPTNAALRSQLHRAVKSRQERYFISLTSPTVYTLNRRGEDHQDVAGIRAEVEKITKTRGLIMSARSRGARTELEIHSENKRKELKRHLRKMTVLFQVREP